MHTAQGTEGAAIAGVVAAAENGGVAAQGSQGGHDTVDVAGHSVGMPFCAVEGD